MKGNRPDDPEDSKHDMYAMLELGIHPMNTTINGDHRTTRDIEWATHPNHQNKRAES
jgi:hypothetical protein